MNTLNQDVETIITRYSMFFLRILLVLLFINLNSCKESEKTPSEVALRPEIIHTFDSKFNGQPLIMSTKEIYETFGAPTQEIQNCVIFSNLASSNTEFKYNCLVYDSISKFGFDTYNKIGYLSYVAFNHKAITLRIPQVELNSEITLGHIKTIFPKSYNLRIETNEGKETLLSLNDHLWDETHDSANIIELGFENGYLKYFKYQIEPEYITILDLE